MKADRVLSASLEDYLEAIWDLGSPARITEIAARLGVAKASATEAARKLAALGLVDYRPYRRVTLTPEGEKRARHVRTRHDALITFLTEVLGVPRVVAEKDSCILEHGLSTVTSNLLFEYVNNKITYEPR